MNLDHILARAGQAAAVLLLGGILLLDRLHPALDPVAEPISHMGASDLPDGWVFNALLAVCALLIAAGAVGLWRAFRAHALPPWPAALVGAFGILGLGGSAAFHCQAACDDSSLLGTLHFVPTTAGLVALLLAVGVMPGYVRALRAGAAIERVVFWAGHLTWASTALYALGAVFMDQRLFPFIGLIQRIFMAAFAVWLFALATWLLRRAANR